MKKWLIGSVLSICTLVVWAQTPQYVQAADVKVRVITGDWIEVQRFYSNGQLMESGHMLFGEPHGLWQSYAEDGTRVCNAYFDHGLKTDTWEFVNPSNTQMVRVRYERDKPVGVMPLYVSID